VGIGLSSCGLDIGDGNISETRFVSIVDANGSKGREGCDIGAKDVDDADEGGDMNAEYTLLVFVFVFDLGY
jgi:hypothetical protein